MNVSITRRRKGAFVAGALAFALLAAACGDDGGSSSDATSATTAGSTTPGATTAAPTSTVKLSGTLQGSGSTFQKPYQDEAIDAFTKKNGGLTITYGGGGSGKGRTDLQQKTVDFAGTDAAYPTGQEPAGILYFPILLGGITLSYNLDGVKDLKLSPDTAAKIFSRTVKKWDDAAIKADNPDASLPSSDIVVVHRADGSGTTQNFTDWLKKTSPANWTLGSGSTVAWAADTQAGTGNAGVANAIKQNKGSIGYVDLSDAKGAGLTYAQVKNKSGKFIEPTSDSSAAVGDGITVPDTLLFSALDSSAADAYPITYQSWVMVYAQQSDKGKGDAIKGYLAYLLGDGQSILKDLDFAPLPKAIQDKAIAQLDKIVVG
jgi:phosphate transport system substrate-binding protein